MFDIDLHLMQMTFGTVSKTFVTTCTCTLYCMWTSILKVPGLAVKTSQGHSVFSRCYLIVMGSFVFAAIM